MSATTSASLRIALVFRAVELSLRPTPRERTPRTLRGAGCPAAQGGDRGSQAVHTTPDRIVKELPDILVSPGDGGYRGSRAGGGEVGPTGTSATVDWMSTSFDQDLDIHVHVVLGLGEQARGRQ